MDTPRSSRTLFLLAAGAVVLLAACSSGPSAAATVNGTDITNAQLADEAAKFTFLAGLNNVPCGTPEGDETAQAACNRFTLSNMVTQRLVADYAAAHDIAVTDAQVNATIQQVESSVGKDALDTQLQKAKIGRPELADLARQILLLNAVQKAVVADRVSDAQLRAQYKKDFLQYVSIQTDHILVKTKAEAEAAYRKVTAPGATEQDFLDLAKKISIDPSAKQNSGSLGTAVASTLVPEFATAAVALKQGEISKPVKTQFGWHVIRLVDKEVTPFAKARDQIVQGQVTTVFDAWMRDQVAADGVEVNPSFGRWNAKTLTIDRIASTDPSATQSPSAQVPVNQG